MVSKSKNFLAVIIPMYNEEKVANRCIEKVLKQLKRESIKSILIVVNDGSYDKTFKILEEWKKNEKKLLHIVHHKVNKGYGGAIQTGINEAIKLGYYYTLTMDSDLTNDPKFIHDFIKAGDMDTDCIKASRYIKGSRVINVPLYRVFISFVGNKMANKLFNVGITDCTNGFRMVKVSKLKGIKFKENDFSIILEELYYLKKKKATFFEIPNTLTARHNSTSHFSYKPEIFYNYFKYALKALFLP